MREIIETMKMGFREAENTYNIIVDIVNMLAMILAFIGISAIIEAFIELNMSWVGVRVIFILLSIYPLFLYIMGRISMARDRDGR